MSDGKQHMWSMCHQDSHSQWIYDSITLNLKRSWSLKSGKNTDWWLGTFLFFHVQGVVIPTDVQIFQTGRYTTNQLLNPQNHHQSTIFLGFPMVYHHFPMVFLELIQYAALQGFPEPGSHPGQEVRQKKPVTDGGSPLSSLWLFQYSRWTSILSSSLYNAQIRSTPMFWDSKNLNHAQRCVSIQSWWLYTLWYTGITTEKSQFCTGKSTISMVIFSSKLLVSYQRVYSYLWLGPGWVLSHGCIPRGTLSWLCIDRSFIYD